MRKALFVVALAVALSASPLSAQQANRRATAAPAAPHLELSAEQQAELRQSVTRGRALAVLLEASRVTTRDMLARVPEAERDTIVGWIARPEGNGVTVTYFARQGEGYAAAYRGQLLGGRISSPQVYAAAARPALAGVEARMASARMTAEALENRPCTGTAFNTVVLPPEGDGPILVYQFTPRSAANKVPTGGHYRVTVAPDGSVAQSTNLAETCEDLTLTPVPAGQRSRPLVVNARDILLPGELYPFLALWAGRPLVVATGTEQVRLWGVTGEGIAELQQ